VLATGFLFKKDKKSRLSRRTRISRDILRFTLHLEEDSKFNQLELSDWLVSNCKAFDFEPGTPTKNKPYKVLREIGPLLGPFVEIGLIYQIGSEPEKNGTGQFAVWRYTKAGRLLALIIDSFDLERTIEDNQKIYEILQSHHSSDKSSKHQFFLALLAAHHQQNNLDDMTEIVRKVLKNVDYIPVVDLMDIYEIVRVRYFTNLTKAKLFSQNWKTALGILEPSVRSVFLYGIKLEYEERMANYKDLGDPRLYEEYRFELRKNWEETALQAKCTNIKCNIVQNLSYKTSNVVTRNFNRPLDIECSACNNLNCLVIPSL
jgi:hypothetical protein